MNYRKIPPGTIGKEKISQTFEFTSIGHKMTLYINAYHNIPVSHVYFYENLAACFQALANQAAEKAKAIRERDKIQTDPPEVPVQTEEEPRKGL
jgi:hypothetical protein